MDLEHGKWQQESKKEGAKMGFYRRNRHRGCGNLICLLLIVSVFFMAGIGKPGVTAKAASKKEVAIDKTEFTLEKKHTDNLYVTVNDEQLAKEKIEWKSSNQSVAAIKNTKDKTATILAKKAGKATITATIKGNKVSCKIKVVNSAKYNAKDKKAIEKLIKVQKAAGSALNGKEYGCVWRIVGKEYRITEINWFGMGVTGKISFAEMPELVTVNCYNNKITDIDISKNSKLKYLRLTGNPLKKLDVSKNTKLETLLCDGCGLESLNVSKNAKLSYLNCGGYLYSDKDGSTNQKGNRLKNLDVSKNPKLTYLCCSYNQLTKLNLKGNAMLTELVSDYNPLKNLDVSNNKKLKILLCKDNKLTKLDVSNNPDLEKLGCEKNKITDLDVSKNPKLKELLCVDNQMTSLDVSKNPDLTFLLYDQVKVTVTGRKDNS